MQVHSRIRVFLLPMILAIFLTGSCGSSGDDKAASAFTLSSSAFAEGASIPFRHVYSLSGQCSGDNFSPPLTWANAPANTQSFAVVMLDSDASDFVHWIQWNLPGASTSLVEAVAGPNVGVKGQNGFSASGYGGPCPPSGNHRYVFTLYALDTTLSLAAGSNRSALDGAMAGHILARATLTGYRSL